MMSNIIKIHLFKNARIGITADTGVAFFCQREDYKLRSDTILSENQIVLDSNAEIGE